MAASRSRGLSFHDETTPSDAEVHFVTPQFEPMTHHQPIEHMKLSLDDDGYPDEDDNDYDSDDGENEDEQEEEARYSRGRSRSRSLHELDEDSNGIVHVDPSTIHPVSEPVKQIDKPERSGPLPQREVETLKKGVEEALTRNPDVAREEQEEQQAAEEERKCRSSQTQSNEVKRIKILMLGDSGVGKSSLIIRWTADTFSTDLVGTVGVNFKTRKVTVLEESIQVQVWDTAGQEQFHKITTSYYKGANGIMLVYDVSDKRSVDNVEYWVRNIKSHASDCVQVALIGNKVDLRLVDPTRCVETSHGLNFSAKFGVPYFETSAKDSTNVEEAFHTLITNILSSDGIDHRPATSVGVHSNPRRLIVEKDIKGKNKKDCIVS